MIYPHSNATQTKWDRGQFKVQINIPDRPRPMGFCDGGEGDEAQLRAMAEEEGVYDLEIRKKILKTGREIWTVIGST